MNRLFKAIKKFFLPKRRAITFSTDEIFYITFLLELIGADKIGNKTAVLKPFDLVWVPNITQQLYDKLRKATDDIDAPNYLDELFATNHIDKDVKNWIANRAIELFTHEDFIFPSESNKQTSNTESV